MRRIYLSNDGREFNSECACMAHEEEVLTEKYDEIFVNGSIKKRAKVIINGFEYICDTCGQSDSALDGKRLLTRHDEDRIPIFTGCEYGVVYLRDDAVDILIKYIRELEKKPKKKAKKKSTTDD